MSYIPPVGVQVTLFKKIKINQKSRKIEHVTIFLPVMGHHISSIIFKISINQLAFYHKCRFLIGYAIHAIIIYPDVESEYSVCEEE